jgi:hypothetical protein
MHTMDCRLIVVLLLLAGSVDGQKSEKENVRSSRLRSLMI